MINTHGLKIDLESLEAVAKETEHVNHRLHQEIFFDLETGDVLYNCTTTGNWTEYRDPAVIKVADTRSHQAPQWIADKIASSVAEMKNCCAYTGDRCDWPVMHP